MKKNIWLINQYASTPETGLAGRHYYFAEELAKQGHNVKVIAGSFSHIMRTPKVVKDNFEIEQRNGFDFVWVKTSDYKSSNSKRRILNWFSFAYKLLKLPKLLDEKPDVILYSSAPLVGFLSAKYLSQKLNAKLIFEVRDIWPLSVVQIGGYSESHPFIRLLQWIEDKAYASSDLVISNLKNSVDHMMSRGLDSNKFRWVPNGVSISEVSADAPLSDEIVKQLPKDKFIIGYTGAFGNANALDYLLESAKQLKEYNDIAFVLVGKGKEKDALKGFARENNLSNVHFVDAIPKQQVQAMLNNFDVCYIGLTSDPLFKFGVSPNKLFDYLYSGRPVLYAIDSGGYKPVKEANAGVEVKPENVNEITSAILKLNGMPKDELVAMGRNGKELVIQSYSYEKLSNQLNELITKL
jgi:glycosyltransferase involved in cell wall biosynthesis